MSKWSEEISNVVAGLAAWQEKELAGRKETEVCP